MIGAVALAGCSRSDGEPLSTADYRNALLAIDTTAADELYYDMVVEPVSRERCTGLIGSFHEEVERVVGEVDALVPPAEVAAVHDRMVEAARESVVRVGEIATAVEAGEVACGNEINDLLYAMPSTERAQAALDELREPVGLPSGE